MGIAMRVIKGIHQVVYRESGRYAGWVANYGMWAWENEIVVMFTVGYMHPTPTPSLFHPCDSSKPFEVLQARSADGGLNWQLESLSHLTPYGRAFSADEHMHRELRLARLVETGEMKFKELRTPIDFSHPGLAMLCARTGLEAGAISWFYTSYDRCRSWDGPFKLPTFGQLGMAARTDYIILGKFSILLMLTVTKPDGTEGRTICVRSDDGGLSFRVVSWVGYEHPDGFAIMPSSILTEDGHIITALRMHAGNKNWIELFASDDEGRSWKWLCTPVEDTGIGGNPPMLLRLNDGRLCLIYGYRKQPYGIRMKLSSDGGITWSDEFLIRDDGGNHDIGYPRAVQLNDGRLIIAYYFNDHKDGERYIATTIIETLP